MCVGSGSHFCTPILTNMCKLTFQVLRLSTFVFNKCSDKTKITIIVVVKSLKGFGWNNVGPDGGPALHRHWANVSSYLVFLAPGC